MILFGEEYLCKCNQEFDPVKVKAQLTVDEVKFQQETINSENDKDESITLDLPSEGRQIFTRWNWCYPNRIKVRSKTFLIKNEKPLSSVEKIILNNFQNKYLYHAIDDILYFLKSKPIERDNLLAILYFPVLSLQNNSCIDFFDIWIDEIYINNISKSNKFLVNSNSNLEPFSYINIKLIYTKKVLSKKPESFW